jgi:hypothetical protein
LECECVFSWSKFGKLLKGFAPEVCFALFPNLHGESFTYWKAVLQFGLPCLVEREGYLVAVSECTTVYRNNEQINIDNVPQVK